MKLLRQAVKSHEKTVILRVLKTYDWDKNKAAKILDIGLSTLYRKIVLLSIPNVKKYHKKAHFENY